MTEETAVLSRESAWGIITEFIQSESLRRHCLSVETAMRAYAGKYCEDEDEWGLVGLLHDFDYEIHPTLDEHPQAGVPILEARGYPDWVIRAILSHADHLDVPRESELEKTLAAVDELTGFIAAVAFVRPSKAVRDVTPQSVRKKMKDKAFARAVDREAMLIGAEELGVDFDEHVQFVIEAMAANAEELGLAGVEVDAR
jgi:putative nucleotidyltransferase with HDIG domain